MGFVPLNSYVKLFALNTRIKGQIALLPAGTPLPFDQDLYDDYLLKEAPFTTEFGQYRVATARFRELTDDVVLKQAKLRKLVSHFIQVFNLMVDRGAAPASDRELLGLPTDSAELPYLGSQNALLTAATNLIKGEADRLAAGRTPMANPAIAEINAAKVDFETALALQGQQDRNVKKEGADVETPFEANEEAVMELVNNVRYRGRKRPFSEVRDILRSLGFQFTPDPGEVFEQEFTIGVNTPLEVEEAPIGGTAKAILTLLTNASGVVANLNGQPSGTPLTFNTPIEVTYQSLGGEADGSGSLFICNGSDVEVQVRVKVVG